MAQNDRQPVVMPIGRGGARMGGIRTFAKPKDMKGTARRLWGYLKKRMGSLVVVFLLVIVSTGASLSASYFIRPLINNFIIPRKVAGLATMLAYLAAIYLAGVTATYLQNRMMIRVSQQTVRAMRTDLFDKIQSLPLRFFDTRITGELMSRFTNDMDSVSNTLNNAISHLFSSAITVTGTLVLMTLISPMLTLVTVVIMPLMIGVANWVIKRSRAHFTAQQRSLGAVNGYIEEIMEGQREVKFFNRENVSREQFETLVETHRKNATKAQLFSGMMMPLMANINTINYALSSAIGGALVVTGVLDVGGFGAFLQYARQFSRPVNEISNQFNVIQSALAGAERMFEIMDEVPETPDAPDAVELLDIRGDVRFDHVSFAYVPGKDVLKDVSFYAKPGQKIALVGSTGAGKTTVTNLITRFYDIDRGSITIDGIDIRKIKKDSLRGALGMVLQDTHLFSGTVLENIRYGRPDATDEECIEAAIVTSADEFIRHLPDGYRTVLENDGENLSQGQRQLLSIARAAVSDPRILILDEATSSIDTRTEMLIEKGMDRIMEGRTTFVIAHRLSTVRNANAILVIENGEIIERGDHDDLLLQKGRYYQLYTGQFELS
jgi:ATP-binding cassette subfamily B protein